MEFVDWGKNTLGKKKTNTKKILGEKSSELCLRLYGGNDWVVVVLRSPPNYLQCLHTFIIKLLFKIIGRCNVTFIYV